MSKRTFNRGFKELLEKDFLSPKSPDTYWVNPTLFFKGDRVRFIKEYRRIKKIVSDGGRCDKTQELDFGMDSE